MGDITLKNILNYYYDIYPNDIIYNENKYFFSYNNNNYIMQKFSRPINDIDFLYDINKKMIDKNILVHEIKKNKFNNIITYINLEAFVLMEYYVNFNKKINLPEICFINNSTLNMECNNVLKRNEWEKLWEIKNDYFESQIMDINKKYKKLCIYANYYIGLAENAIIYAKKTALIEDKVFMCICHKRINSSDTMYELYHPFNYIYDYRVRDLAEYIKSVFFSNKDVTNIIEEYFYNNYLTYKEALLFYSRLLYPTYFFDLYDDITNDLKKESEIEKVLLLQKKYEEFLFKIHSYLSKLYNRKLPDVEWLFNRQL